MLLLNIKGFESLVCVERARICGNGVEGRFSEGEMVLVPPPSHKESDLSSFSSLEGPFWRNSFRILSSSAVSDVTVLSFCVEEFSNLALSGAYRAGF